MKEIPLTQGKSAFVDDEDFEIVNLYKWQAKRRPSGLWYAARCSQISEGRPRRVVFMHRAILGAPFESDVDHRDGNGLNNQRLNLRLCTERQNGANRKLNNGRRFKGVYQTRGRRFEAAITNNKRKLYLGSSLTEEGAAKIYDTAASRLFGEFARLNFPK